MKITASYKNLIYRYLIWAYKTTKESFERIERKTTQLVVDHYLLSALHKAPNLKNTSSKAYEKLVGEFEQYIAHKSADEIKQKYVDEKKKDLNPEYLYLKNRLSAIEGAIKHFLGPKELKRIESLYEEEFIKRILQSKDH